MQSFNNSEPKAAIIGNMKPANGGTEKVGNPRQW
jgi:hypothetical protein